MDFTFLAILIKVVAQVFIWIVIVKALLSYFLSPYHAVRQVLDRIVEPFLNPIRRVVPSVGMFDFSPLILIIVVELASRILVSLLLYLS